MARVRRYRRSLQTLSALITEQREAKLEADAAELEEARAEAALILELEGETIKTTAQYYYFDDAEPELYYEDDSFDYDLTTKK